MTKPKPPADMWAKIEEDVSRELPKRPKDSFTVKEMMKKTHLTADQIYRLLARWLQEGRVKKFKSAGVHCFYVLVDKP